MKDAFLLCLGQRFRTLHCHREERIQRQAANVFQPPTQRAAIHILHDQQDFVVLFEDVVNAGDVFRTQGGSTLGFLQDALPRLRGRAELGEQALEGDRTVQLSVLGVVDFAHPACTELVSDHKPAYLCSRQIVGKRKW